MRGHAGLERLRVRVVGVTERLHLGQRTVGQGLRFRLGEQRVRPGRAAHRLGGVVDQDVEGALRGDRVGEGDHLGGIAKVDPDDAQTVQPVARIGQRREPSHGIPREPGGDGQVGSVAQQTESDVHPDLRAAAGEQRALAGEVGASGALGVAERCAVGTELVVERVDERVVLLADVAGARLEQRARATIRWRSP